MVWLKRGFQALDGRVRLVLHGTKDFAPDLCKACMEAGVTKINVNKLVLDPWHPYLRANVNKPLNQLMDEGILVLAKEMERWMDIMGSSGKGIARDDTFDHDSNESNGFDEPRMYTQKSQTE